MDLLCIPCYSFCLSYLVAYSYIFISAVVWNHVLIDELDLCLKAHLVASIQSQVLQGNTELYAFRLVERAFLPYHI